MKNIFFLFLINFYFINSAPTESQSSQGMKISKLYSKSECKNDQCKSKHIASLGNVEIDREENTLSKFGAQVIGEVSFGEVKGSADVHIMDVEAEKGPVKMGYNLGKLGVNAHVSMDKGVGIGIDAKLGEASMQYTPIDRPFFRWLGFGGKFGLSADTSASIGATTGLKVLGSGISIGVDKGLELCWIGNCFNIG